MTNPVALNNDALPDCGRETALLDAVQNVGELGILHHDFRERRTVILCHVRDLDRDAARDLFVCPGDGAVRVSYHRRISGICLLTDADVQRQAAQEFHVVIGAHLFAAARTKDMFFVAAF
jgi:hypothetical protein